jgi:hypothetical protein
MPFDQIEQPFDSIESAYEFMNVLAETILLNMSDLRDHHKLAVQDGQDRRAKAIELALFKAKILSCYVHKSRRTLNDLRTIRRLILNERMTAEDMVLNSEVS